MAKDQKKEAPNPEEEQEITEPVPEQETPETEPAEVETAEAETSETAETPGEAKAPLQEEKPAKDKDQLLAEAADKYLRLAAEYDNYRKRTAKEKKSIWSDAKVQAVAAFLPVYDNLERALKQETADEAYKKGVEMTMKGLQDAMTGLGVELIPALGETFDPNRHNAVMHCEDETAGENTIVEVFQQGFICGEKVIRFSMVKVAN